MTGRMEARIMNRKQEGRAILTGDINPVRLVIVRKTL